MKYLLALFLCVGAAYAADPVVPPFILPPAPTPTPPPPPPAGVPIPLLPGHPFVIRLNAANVLASPEGVVKMKTKAEPVTVVDADGNDTEYTGDKSVCFVWPAKGASGPCELLIVPTDGSAVGRVQLVIGTPTPPVPPVPPTPANSLTATFQAAYSLDMDVGKESDLKWLTSVYFNAPALLSPLPANYIVLQTDLSTMYHVPSGFPKGGMSHLVSAISTELTSAFGSSATAPVDAAKGGCGVFQDQYGPKWSQVMPIGFKVTSVHPNKDHMIQMSGIRHAGCVGRCL